MTSASPPKADISKRARHVRFVPEADIGKPSRASPIGRYGIFGTYRSFRLDARRPDHLAPLLGVGSDPRAEFFRTARDRVETERRHALLDVRQRHDPDDLAVEQVDDLLGRPARDRDAEPRFALDV